MEKIKVNMSPNPLDVQTIHASQNDGEARQWEFELHNNGELIDTSDITEQMFFKAYKGGTEQILPENTSTPTTSPFIGDIKYPQGLLTNQEFTYRQSPTESDGLAKITDIKGNTLVWNQLVQNGNFADTSRWVKGSGASSLVISNNEAVITIGGAWNNDIRQNQSASFISGHKYFVSFEAKASVPMSLGLATINVTPEINFAILTNAQTTFKKIASIATVQSNADSFRIVLVENGTPYIGETFTVRNVQIIDLTAMGLDITDPSDFASLFSLPYYDYNLGTLLSFSGTGLKISGKNLSNVSSGNNVVIAKVRKGIPYVFSMKVNGDVGINLKANNKNGNVLVSTSSYSSPLTFTPQEDCDVFVNGYSNVSGKTFIESTGEFQIEFGSVASDFEPYTSSTLSLPISTYFPTGMKSAGSVYDELTPNKAIMRISRVDMGTLDYIYNSASNRFQAPMPSDYKIPASASERENVLCANYETNSNPLQSSGGNGITGYQGSQYIFIRDTAYTDITAFKASLSGKYLYYEIATPTETSFTTASLVTENAEIPLSNNDGVLLGKCTEELSAEPGFHDAKIKLSDSDGECYSNKIQLHVERKPS